MTPDTDTQQPAPANKSAARNRPRKKTMLILGVAGAVTAIALFHLWLHLTNPYAARNIVQQPYTTSVKNGHITVEKQFSLRASHGTAAQAFGYYKSGFLIVQNAWFGSQRSPGGTADEIIADIHRARFDPGKPYLISGDQFSVLYPRNLGVFYNSLLNPHTALSKKIGRIASGFTCRRRCMRWTRFRMPAR